MQSVSSRIWTRVAVSISYVDNHYTTGTCVYVFMCVYVGVCMNMCFKEWIIKYLNPRVRISVRLHFYYSVCLDVRMPVCVCMCVCIYVSKNELLSNWIFVYVYVWHCIVITRCVCMYVCMCVYVPLRVGVLGV